MKLQKTKTKRGFKIIRFTTQSGVKCNIQKSSSIMENAIWIGAEEIDIREPTPDGYKPMKLPDNVIANERIHLTQKEVKKLLPILQKFVETGEI